MYYTCIGEAADSSGGNTSDSTNGLSNASSRALDESAAECELLVRTDRDEAAAIEDDEVAALLIAAPLAIVPIILSALGFILADVDVALAFVDACTSLDDDDTAPSFALITTSAATSLDAPSTELAVDEGIADDESDDPPPLGDRLNIRT